MDDMDCCSNLGLLLPVLCEEPRVLGVVLNVGPFRSSKQGPRAAFARSKRSRVEPNRSDHLGPGEQEKEYGES